MPVKASELVVKRSDETVGRGVAEATFHLRAWDDGARDGVKRASQRVFLLIEPHATNYMSGSGTRPKKMARAATTGFLASLDKAGKEIRLVIHSGKTPDEFAPWSFECNVDPEDLHFSVAGSLTFSLPAEMLETSPGEFRKLFVDLAAMMRAEAAQGGYAVGFIRGDVSTPRDEGIRGLITRYRGLDCEDASSTSSWAAEQIKGPGWLTFLGPKFCERLGGQTAIRQALSKAVEIVELPTGLVLVAGPAPRLGDVNAAEDMTPYVEVARLIKPLRMDKPLPLPGLDREQMAAWLARFDEP